MIVRLTPRKLQSTTNKDGSVKLYFIPSSWEKLSLLFIKKNVAYFVYFTLIVVCMRQSCARHCVFKLLEESWNWKCNNRCTNQHQPQSLKFSLALNKDLKLLKQKSGLYFLPRRALSMYTEVVDARGPQISHSPQSSICSSQAGSNFNFYQNKNPKDHSWLGLCVSLLPRDIIPGT